MPRRTMSRSEKSAKLDAATNGFTSRPRVLYDFKR